MAVTNSTRVITPELFEQEYNASISTAASGAEAPER